MSADDHRSMTGEVLSSSDEGSNENPEEQPEASLIKSKIQKWKNKHKLAKNQLEGLRQSISHMQEMNKSLAVQLDAEKKSSKENTEKLKEKKDKIKELEERIHKLEEENRTIRQKNASLTKELADRDLQFKGPPSPILANPHVRVGTIVQKIERQNLQQSMSLPKAFDLSSVSEDGEVQRLPRSSTIGFGPETAVTPTPTPSPAVPSNRSRVTSPPGAIRRAESWKKELNRSTTTPNIRSMHSATKSLVVRSNDGKFELTTAVGFHLTVREIIVSIQRKFPGDTSNFHLFHKLGKHNYLRLDPEKKLSTYAAEYKGLSEAKIYLEFDDPVNYKGQGGKLAKIPSLHKDERDSLYTSLIDAIKQRNVDKVRAAMNVSEISRFEAASVPPLSEALATGHHPVIDLVLGYYETHSTLKVNATDKIGWTPLHCAVSYCVRDDRDEDILERLLGFSNIIVDAPNDDMNTPLHFFVQKFESPSCSTIGQKLISQAPLAVNAKNKNGETPLHKAIFNAKVRLIMVKLLLNHNANPNLHTREGETALHYAVRMGRKDLVKVLIFAGAESHSRELRENKTAEDLAIELGQNDIAEILKDCRLLSEWLKQENLAEYNMIFMKQDLTLDQLASLNKEEAEELIQNMNIEALGVRIRIQKSIDTLSSNRKSEKGKRIMSKSSFSRNEPELAEQARRIEEFKLGLKSEESIWLIDVDDLEFTKELGQGANGRVYKGILKKKETSHKVAIKVLKNTNEQSLIGFKKEFVVMSMVQSHNVIHFFGACIDPKRVLIVMEYCKLGSLYDVLNSRNFKLNWEKGIRFARDMINGLASLHGAQPPIYHRDMKTMNLLVNKEWEVKVTDMGLARQDTSQNQASMGQVCGTYAYLAPEVLKGGVYTEKSDIYSIGIILWEIATRITTGQYTLPYEMDIAMEHMVAVRAAEEQARPEIPPGKFPEAWENLTLQCWHQDPASRPMAKEILARLMTMIHDEQVHPQQWVASDQTDE
eukprot:TRINITY_DN3114_c0_g1_i1.p1 TRINITY_DN3114_c0_g1~~TRINITY_DN3114_c0_g1_i1.p1  ORF type:complete len:992 (+),score=287.31 TRINITY_DN3114_c0_g1_i1:99-3074(+)